MESLALIVVGIFLGIIGLFLASTFVAVRNPQKTWARTLGTIVGVLTVVSGGWIAYVGDTLAARAMAAAILIAGVTASARSIRRG